MADAKVIPFDDDRSRGGAQRSGRRRGQSAGSDRARDGRQGRGRRQGDDGNDARNAGATSDGRDGRDGSDGRDGRDGRDPDGSAGAGTTRTETDASGGPAGEVATLPGQQTRGTASRATGSPASAPRGTRTARAPRRASRPGKAREDGADGTGGADAGGAGSTGGAALADGTAPGSPVAPDPAASRGTTGRAAPEDASAGDSADGGGSRGRRTVRGRARAERPGGSAEGARPGEGARSGEGAQAGTVTDEGETRRGTGADGEAEARGTGGESGRWERHLASGLAFLRRRLTGDYEVDDFGYDPELTDQVLMSVLRLLYQNYFRVDVRGIENIPSEGGALIVANHSGTLPLDGLMMQVAVHDRHPAQRHLRLLAADLVFMVPVVNELARKAGHTLACAEDAEVLLGRGEVVGVMPEGFKGLGKPFSERYKLQRFGRGGFVSTALRAGAPIVPCSIVGAEEIYPMIGNARTVARLLGFPYFPVTPTFPWLGPLGAVPLPTKWTIEFGEPIETSGYAAEAAEDPMLMFNLTDQVREQIQHTLYRLLVQRRSVFF